MATLLDVRGLSRHFGPITAVDNVSFAVERGEVLGFLGPNGAGKTTTMRMIAGYPGAERRAAPASAASTSATDPIEVKRRIGYLPEGAPLYGDMTPRRLPRLRRLDARLRRRRAAPAADRRGRAHAAGRACSRQPIETLSKGFKRRVGAAPRPCCTIPTVLILDEPTDGLDPNQKHEVRELIARMAPSKAIVISTHILEEVEAVCTRAIIIAHGRIVADGTPEVLRARSDRHNAVTLRLSAVEARAGDAGAAAAAGGGARRSDGAGRRRGRPAGAARRTAAASPRRSAPPARAGVGVEELSGERGRLDDVFRSITSAP